MPNEEPGSPRLPTYSLTLTESELGGIRAALAKAEVVVGGLAEQLKRSGCSVEGDAAELAELFVQLEASVELLLKLTKWEPPMGWVSDDT